MDKFLALICPNSPFVWDGKGFCDCFEDIVLGFGVNIVTIIMIVVLGIKQKIGRRVQRSDVQVPLSEKFALGLVPAIGACLSVLDIIFLWKKELSSHFVGYHKWFYSCSELIVWTEVILFSKCASNHYIVFNRILCFWWILKSMLGVFYLMTIFSSLKVSTCIIESLVVPLNITFGIAINVIRVKRASKSSLLEDPLLSHAAELEEGGHCDFGNNVNFWDLMTFKFITPVMNHGVVKQLDSEDLLQLPTDMDPSSCHDIILSYWRAQLTNDGSNPSLFRALCSSYGWPYLRLGLLKVINDCIGFVGPLLLNKLIQFLQQGVATIGSLCLSIVNIQFWLAYVALFLLCLLVISIIILRLFLKEWVIY